MLLLSFLRATQKATGTVPPCRTSYELLGHTFNSIPLFSVVCKSGFIVDGGIKKPVGAALPGRQISDKSFT